MRLEQPRLGHFDERFLEAADDEHAIEHSPRDRWGFSEGH
jgi:hypothetical protein